MASGLIEWSNAIRFTMANDPGREIFRDQVNNHGFLFLDDYLANILQGAKQDPMIELLKTPGRKKPPHKKPKTMSKLNQLVAIPSSVIEGSPENDLEDKSTSHVRISASHTGLTWPAVGDHNPDETNPLPPPSISTTATLAPQQSRELLVPHSEQKDLSVIAEDDENGDIQQKELFEEDNLPTDGEPKQTEVIVPTHSEHISRNIEPFSPIPSNSTFPPLSTASPRMDREEHLPIDNPSPTNPLRNHTDTDTVRQIDTPPELSENAEAKVGSMLYPALPGPIPLRKSMRAPRDPSMNVPPVHAVTPGTALGRKRTSWLKKAREVKALETTSKTMISAVTPAPPNLKSLKRKSGDVDHPSEATGLEDEERRYKTAKNNGGAVASTTPKISASIVTEHHLPPNRTTSPELRSAEKAPTEAEGMLDRFKRTVEDLGARVGKTMGVGKPLGGGTVAVALAEARAAAEARVAERVIQKDESTAPLADIVPPVPEVTSLDMLVEPQDQSQRRLSVSDLFPPKDGTAKMKSRNGLRSSEFVLPTQATRDAWKDAQRESITTTPPNSPPLSQQHLTVPPERVFNKPPPVFIPPAPPSPVSKPERHVSIFQNARSPPPAFFQPSAVTQEKLVSGAGVSQHTGSSGSGFQPQDTRMDTLDETDTWSTAEKQFTSHWLFGAGKDDSLTSSTFPSQNGDTGTFPQEITTHQANDDVPDAIEVDMDEEEGEDYEPRGDTSLVEIDMTTSDSQMSFASSQSQPGFLGSATKILGHTLGMNKKGKPEVKKVLQKAAAAAKKQQEENDKKAARRKEVENRRQQAMQRKIDEEKTKALEQERKVKEESERRKREREETTEKRPLKLGTTSKKEEENVKKRKVTVAETEKKEIKKLPSKPILKSAMKTPMALSSSAAFNSSGQTNSVSTVPNPGEAKPSRLTAQSEKGKSKMTPSTTKRNPEMEDDFTKPSQLVQIQMAARAKAQLQAARQDPEPIPSESIELPDINSEYSDSEDEDRPRTYDPPGWAQSPELREALRVQSTINPDDIFGVIPPLKMDELFKARTSRFRARTSSANWTGADRLTVEEEREYAKRMGFK